LHRLIKEMAEGPAIPLAKGGRMHEIMVRPDNAEWLGASVTPFDSMTLVGAPALALRHMRVPAASETAGSSTWSAAATASAGAAGTVTIPAAPPCAPPEGRPSCLRDRHCFHSNHTEALEDDADATIALQEIRESTDGGTSVSSTGADAATAWAAAAGRVIPTAPPCAPPNGRPSCLRDRHCFHSNHTEAFDKDADTTIALRELS
jgi:hypothetical protein